MKTSPFDDPVPFVLLPQKRESAWSRLVRLAFRVFNGLKHEQRAVKGISQISGSGLGASQIGNHDGFTGGLARTWHRPADNKANVNQAQYMAEGRSGLECNNGAAFIGQSKNVGANPYSGLYTAGYGGIAHDGSFKFFKWDNAKGCMVPYEPSTPLARRFQRSFDAFMRSWRLE